MLPLLPIGLALTGASILGNGRANQKIDRAREQVAAAEVERQRRYRAQAESALGEAMKGWELSEAQKTLAGEGAKLTAANQAAIAAPGGAATPSLTAEAPGGIAQVYLDAVARQGRAGALDAERQAAIGALGQWMQGRNVDMSRAGQKINQAASFAQGSSAVLPSEFEQANNSARGLRNLSNLFGHLGWAATIGGLWGDGPAPAAPRNPVTGFGCGGV